MKFDRVLEHTRGLPVIESSTLRVFGAEPRALSVQLDRWVRAGKLLRLRRGVYALAERYRKTAVAAESIANLLHAPSYVSLERALHLHGLIPEQVPLVQSVTTRRPARFKTSLGEFSYRHVKRSWFFGYEEIPLLDGSALVATPEKALLDLAYFSTGELTSERIEEMRLQDVERIDAGKLEQMARGAGRPRMRRAARRLREHIEGARRATVKL
jgi:predicted transcriptional regulator of viral defense system